MGNQGAFTLSGSEGESKKILGSLPLLYMNRTLNFRRPFLEAMSLSRSLCSTQTNLYGP